MGFFPGWYRVRQLRLRQMVVRQMGYRPVRKFGQRLICSTINQVGPSIVKHFDAQIAAGRITSGSVLPGVRLLLGFIDHDAVPAPAALAAGSAPLEPGHEGVVFVLRFGHRPAFRY